MKSLLLNKLEKTMTSRIYILIISILYTSHLSAGTFKDRCLEFFASINKTTTMFSGEDTEGSTFNIPTGDTFDPAKGKYPTLEQKQGMLMVEDDDLVFWYK